MDSANLQYLAPAKNVFRTSDIFIPPPSSPNQIQWMLQSSQVSDADLAESLVDRYYPDLYRLALVLGGSPTGAALSAEAALAQAVDSRHDYWGKPALFAWLIEILLDSPLGSTFAGLDLEKIPSSTASSLSDLPRPLAFAFILLYLHDLPVTEIGAFSGMNFEKLEAAIETAYRQSYPSIASNSSARLVRVSKDTAAFWPSPAVDPAALARKILTASAHLHHQRTRWVPAKPVIFVISIIALMVFLAFAIDLFQPNPTYLTQIYVVQVTATPLP